VRRYAAVVPVKPAKCEPSEVTGGRKAQCLHVTETKSCGGKLGGAVQVECN
jgi:hypothetical protein